MRRCFVRQFKQAFVRIWRPCRPVATIKNEIFTAAVVTAAAYSSIGYRINSSAFFSEWYSRLRCICVVFFCNRQNKQQSSSNRLGRAGRRILPNICRNIHTKGWMQLHGSIWNNRRREFVALFLRFFPNRQQAPFILVTLQKLWLDLHERKERKIGLDLSPFLSLFRQ